MAKPLTKSEAVRKANAIKIANPDFKPAKIKAIIEKQNGPLVFDGEPFYFKSTGRGTLAIESVNVKNTRKARANTTRTASAAKQTAGKDVYKKGLVTPKGSKLQEHHKRALAIYAPFFEGLNDQETKELAQWFVDEGAPLGNVEENLEALPEKEHDAIHDWMKKNLMQVDPKDFPSFKNYSLNERFVPALTFLEQVQPAADEQLELIKSDLAALQDNLKQLDALKKLPRFASKFAKSNVVEKGVELFTASDQLAKEPIIKEGFAKVQDPFEAAAKARERGGKIKVGNVTLPELGLSEFFMPPKQ